MKYNILMICSWLDLKKKLGSFFVEQAHMLNKDSNIILCHIQEKKKTPLWKYYRYIKYNNTRIQRTEEHLPVYEMLYPTNDFLPKSLNNKIYHYFIKKLFKTIEKNEGKVDLIHAQSLLDAGLQASYIHRIFKTPFIFTEHNQLSFIGVNDDKIREIKKILKSPYSKLVVSLDKVRQFATNHLFADFINIGNSVDEKTFNYTIDNNINHNTLTISTIGAFYPIKDQITILKALEIVDNQIEQKIKYNWIGFNGWGHDETSGVKNTLKSFDFKNIEVSLFPFLEKQDIAKKLNSTDLFLFSSLTEGMPVSILEALACGVPVCSTNCGGVDEIINDSNGKIIPIKDYKAMASFILNYIENEGSIYNRKKISQEAINQFGSETFRKRMLTIYNKNINTNGY